MLFRSDYRLAAGSICIDASGRLPGSLAAYPVSSQFQSPQGGMPRPVNGAAADLGSFEAVANTPTPTPTPTPTSPLNAPANLRAAAIAATQVQLNWNDRSANETGFLVQRSLDGRGWETIARTTSNATSAIDPTAVAGRRYAYRVVAIDASEIGRAHV